MDQVTRDYFWDDKIEQEYRAYERYEAIMRQLYKYDWAPFDVEYDYKL